MKKGISTIAVIILIGFILVISSFGIYNKLVKLDEGVNKTWADVQSSYQRRADLIPNLVNTVKGYADHEQQTLIKVIEERAKATQPVINTDLKNLSEESLANFQKMQGELNSAISRLLVTVERYPDLKANENFLQLQAQLEGTENRINVERRNFNEAVNKYNADRRKFPAIMFARLFGFSEKPYFTSQPGSEEAPKVEF